MRIDISLMTHCACITAYRTDAMERLCLLPRMNFDRLASRRRDAKTHENRFLVYPIGDFEKLANAGDQYGERPTWEVEERVYGTPEGLVWEIDDHILGEMARSLAIPWEKFKESEIISMEI